MEVYDLNWREKDFIRLLEEEGFYYNDLSNQICPGDGSVDTPFLGHITNDKREGLSGYLVLYDEFEKRDAHRVGVKGAFSKLRKLAQEF